MKEKRNVEQFSRTDFLGIMTGRLKAMATGPNAPVPDLLSYVPNRLANELHPGVQYLKVKEIIAHSPDMKSFILAPDAARGTRSLAWFSAGQYIVILLNVDGKIISRPYSIASSPRDTLDGTLRITVKRVEGGIASGHMLDTWAVGTEIVASAPLGDFTYEPLRDARTVIGIAGGSGITPFRAFAKAITEGDEDFSLVLLYGSRTKADAVFSDEFAAMAEADPRIKLVNVLSEEKIKGCEHGFITAKLIKKYAPKDADYSIFLCGPQAMYDFADKEIATLGIRRKFVRHELFGEYFHPERNADYTGDIQATYKLTVRIAGTEQTVDCPADTSLLRAMEQAGIEAPSDCRSGRCGWCHSQLLSGEVYVPESVDGRRLADKIYGYIHPCCTFPLSDVTIDVPPMPHSR
ncbi:MAG: iron-sulfur cluster-binding domain-containing protein [Clostridia bacterium]|nr:iron-sulfur cluster-binding domain-containing protein [Clostridia bacterium]MBR3551900.1 iron-sulfur cluster-binding domain-containing protein [Clostridia bacterium]